jgi:glycosyltransferase involved in cell wall biosynthesis
MRIVIDAYQASNHITGTDRLAHNMLRELQILDTTNEYIIFTNKKYTFVSDVVTARNFRIIPLEIHKRAIWLMFMLPLQLLRLRANVFFSFHNFGGPGIRVCRTISSLLDTIPISQPELYFDKDSSIRKAVVTATMKRASASANKFMAISQFTKQSAIKDVGIPSDKIEVIYLQADPIFFKDHSAEELKLVKAKYNLPANFVFTIGASEPRKNVAGLAEAYSMLPKKLQQEFPLIVAGKKWHTRSLDIENNHNIRLAGFIEDQDLPAVYSLATVFAFVSKYEGFGLPVLEAMASGTPVITSTATSLPEVAGEAAIMVDPESITEISETLNHALKDRDLRQKLTKLGSQQVKKFSWQQAALSLHSLITAVS